MEHVIVTTRPAAAEPARDAAKPELVEALLAALTDMAVRSPRRQADLAVALRRSGLRAPPVALREALAALEDDGCIEHLVPLTDGGLLMQITAHGIERLSKTSWRAILGVAD
jgi:hypothetical protein